MNEEVRDFHFNVNVRTGGGSKAKMANNEDSFLRAMEIQERKREKKELIEQEEERLRAAQAPIVEIEEPVLEEETEDIETVPAIVAEVPIEPESPKAAPTPKPTGGGVPGPKPRSDFSPEERAAMLKRAKAHAAEVAAKNSK